VNIFLRRVDAGVPTTSNGSRGGVPFLGFLSGVMLIVLAQADAQWIADPVIDTRVQKGIDHIYNIEFDAADREFAQIIALRPDHPAGYFFQAMTQWWRILSNFDDESKDEQFYSLIERVVRVCEQRLKRDKNDVTALFFKGGAIGFRGRLRVNRGKWLAAADDGVTALSAIRKAHELDANNTDVLLGIGIYNYYAEVVPTQYPILKPIMLFLPSGNKQKGLDQLEQAAASAKYAKVEAMYFLLQTYFSYEKQYVKALDLALQLHRMYPRNPLFHRMYGRCFVSLGNWKEAHRVFSEVEQKFRNRQQGYDIYDGREAYYYLGRYQFLFGDLNEALRLLYKCDELSRTIDQQGPSGFMSMANLTIGMIYDLQGRRASAQAQYQKVLNMKEYERAHEEARRYLQEPYRR